MSREEERDTHRILSFAKARKKRVAIVMGPEDHGIGLAVTRALEFAKVTPEAYIGHGIHINDEVGLVDMGYRGVDVTLSRFDPKELAKLIVPPGPEVKRYRKRGTNHMLPKKKRKKRS